MESRVQAQVTSSSSFVYHFGGFLLRALSLEDKDNDNDRHKDIDDGDNSKEDNDDDIDNNIVSSIRLSSLHYAFPLLTEKKPQFVGGNITARNAVVLIDLLTTAVYESSANVDATPYDCDVTGMATLHYPAARNKQRSPVIDNMDNPIRAVTTASLFVPMPWATGHKKRSIKNKAMTSDQARDFYTHDFDDTAAL